MFQKSLRGVAQVVERYFREVEAASSSLVTPIWEPQQSRQKWLPGFFISAGNEEVCYGRFKIG